MRLSDFPRRVGPLSDDVRCLFQTLRDITISLCLLFESDHFAEDVNKMVYLFVFYL